MINRTSAAVASPDTPGLLDGWAWTRIGDVAHVNPRRLAMGIVPPDAPVTVVPMAAVDGESGTIAAPTVQPFKSIRKGLTPFQDGDVIVAKITPCMENGKAAVARNLSSGVAFGSTEFHVLRPCPAILPEYLFYFVRQESFRREAEANMSGNVGQRRVPASFLAEHAIPLPPLAEQRRIVAALDAALARVNAARGRLARVPDILRRYRAAVLSAAVEGRLTEDWRAAHPDAEPADVLLRRILGDRQRTWEEAERERYAKALKTPPSDWRSRYKSPDPPDTNELPELPEGWCWSSLEALLTDIEAGANFDCLGCPPEGDEYGVVKISAVTWGEYDEAESKTCLDPRRINPRLLIQPGDFLFSRANTINLVGACVIARRVSRNVMLSDKVLRLRFIDIPQSWLLVCLQSPHGRSEIEGLATGNQQSMRNIGQDRIRRIRVPLPPMAELRESVSRVDDLLARAQVTEATVGKATAQVEQLASALLAKAFRGELVPQDPADEPAAVLLERVRVARTEDGEPSTRTGGRQRRPRG